MGEIALSGALSGGPPAGAGATFPSARFNVELSTRETKKQFGVATGVLTRVLSSPSAFVTLDGVGAAATVTQGDFLYFKCDGQLDLRLTQDDGASGTTVQVVPVHGIVILEFPSTKALELLEAQGSGKIEYLVSGQT
jgi:hypothetical protein